MTIAPGSKLGNYEIGPLLGAGGMGEVYRARDVRIGRDVAIKVLPEELVANQDRLGRFQREAQSAGSLNHPNLLTIHEFGSDGERTFIVSELLDGVTLRERLSGGPLAPRRAIEFATQIAAGLAAAHEQGIVHRDLKPENIFITKDGRLKILDFGLAKTASAPKPGATQETTAALTAGTDPGTVLGTAGYMSPEQVRGEAVDARSDIFSLGAILYEMVSGRRAFQASSSVETMNAILNMDPPELSRVNADVPPALERIINHCLEKNREQRFQSARDLAFDLGSISGTTGETIARRERMLPRATWMWIGALVAIAITSWFAARATKHNIAPRFTRLTFQSRPAAQAVFSPDEQSIVYSNPAMTNADEVFTSGIGSPEARNLGLTPARVLALSSRGELAILRNPHYLGGFSYEGTLARVPLSGGAPRDVLEHVQWADWTPAADDLLIARYVDGKTRIELPADHVLYETAGWVQSPKISPDGTRVAWIDHPMPGNDAGAVMLLDLRAKASKTITPQNESIQGLAWDPDSRHVFYTAAPEGNQTTLFRVALDGGKPQFVVSAPGALHVHAVARDGRVLVSASDIRMKMMGGTIAEANDRELSWLDWSLVRDLSPDGKVVLFDETGQGGAKGYSVYMRPTDGGPAVRLGDGIAGTISPDQKSVLAIRVVSETPQIFLYSTGAGKPVQITNDSMRHNAALFLPDGKSILFIASDGKSPGQLYRRNLSGGAAEPIGPQGVSSYPLCSPDGRWVAIRDPERIFTLYPLHGGPEVKLAEIAADYVVVGWSADSKALYLVHRNINPAELARLDIATRAITPIKQFTLPDSPIGINNLRLTSDGQKYVYSYMASRSDLYIIDGLK